MITVPPLKKLTVEDINRILVLLQRRLQEIEKKINAKD
jgi:hypothetical protein